MDQKQIIERIQGVATASSDVDLLLRFNGRATFDGHTDLKLFLEELLERRVDLVIEQALREEARARV